MTSFEKRALKILAKLGLGSFIAVFGGRFLLHKVAQTSGQILFSDPYKNNLLELASAIRRTGAQTVAESNLRSESATPPLRPLGSPRRYSDLDQLLFSPTTVPKEGPIDSSVILGPNFSRPLRLGIPLLIGGMAYGLGLSQEAKYALAAGSSSAKTATNTGEGPMLASERRLADHLIIQYHRGHWGNDASALSQADMVELAMGQGARSWAGSVIKAKDIDPVFRERLGIAKGEDAVIQSLIPEFATENLPDLLQELQQRTNGAPVSAKIPLDHNIESHLDRLLDAGIRLFSLDGTQAGSAGTIPILQEDFGLPTLIGLCRAVNHLTAREMRTHVQIIVGGGLFTPGHFLKALALGADAVYIGTMAVYAISHKQSLKTLPFEPPTTLLWHGGKHNQKFDWRLGATYLANYLQACTAEMSEATRTLGKSAIRDVSRQDLVALDPHIAAIAKVQSAQTGGYAPEMVTPEVSAHGIEHEPK